MENTVCVHASCLYMGQSLHYSTLAVITNLAVVVIASQGTTLLNTGTCHSTTGSGNPVMWPYSIKSTYT